MYGYLYYSFASKMNSKLMEIVMLELDIAKSILLSKEYTVLHSISLACSLFNEITKEEMKKLHEEKELYDREYYKNYIPDRIQDIIITKYISMNPQEVFYDDDISEYKSIEEYDEELKRLFQKISVDNREYIIKKMKRRYAYFEDEYDDPMNVSRMYVSYDLDNNRLEFGYDILRPICIEYSSLILMYLDLEISEWSKNIRES